MRPRVIALYSVTHKGRAIAKLFAKLQEGWPTRKAVRKSFWHYNEAVAWWRHWKFKNLTTFWNHWIMYERILTQCIKLYGIQKWYLRIHHIQPTEIARCLNHASVSWIEIRYQACATCISKTWGTIQHVCHSGQSKHSSASCTIASKNN